MTIDRKVVYAKWSMDEYGAYSTGNYLDFTWVFEGYYSERRDILTEDFCPIMVVTDLEVLERYKEACRAYEKACEDLRAVLVRPTELPELPPVPEGHRWADHDEWGSDTEYNADCLVESGCDHWHAYVCKCGGECTCHWSDDVPRPKSDH